MIQWISLACVYSILISSANLILASQILGSLIKVNFTNEPYISTLKASHCSTVTFRTPPELCPQEIVTFKYPSFPSGSISEAEG